MARVPTLAQTERPIGPFSVAVRKLAFAGRTCAYCGSYEIRPSKSRNALDILLACLFLTPFRCRLCRERFYKVWRPSLMRPPDPPVAPLLVLPARREALDDETVSPYRIEPAPLHPPRSQPRFIRASKPAAAAKSAFIQRLEIGLRSPQPLPDMPPGPILIFESDLSIRKLLRRLLERRGYTPVEIDKAENLAAELRDRRADLLIVDLSANDSIETQALIALARAHPGLKILALSSEPQADAVHDREYRRRWLTLPKPFPLDSFLDAVDRLLERAKPHSAQ